MSVIVGFILPPLILLQGLLWAILPRRWFPWAVLLVFAAHWVVLWYGLWEIDQLAKLPYCGDAPPGANCNRLSELDPGLGSAVIVISAIVWALISIPFAGLRWLARPKADASD